MILEGRFYFAKQSKSELATLTLGQNQYRIETQGGQKFDFTDIKINAKLGSLARKFNFADGSCFECPDHNDIDLWLNSQKISSIDHLAHHFESSWRAIAFLAAFSIPLLLFTYTKGIPLFANWTAFHLPAKVQLAMGNQVLKTLDKIAFEETHLSLKKQAEVRQDFQALLANQKPNSIGVPISLHFRGGGAIGANALAIPNGNIVITDELIELAKGNRIAIQGILAHEIGHLKHRHSLRQAITLTIIPVLLAVVAGDLVNSSQIAASLPVVFLEQGYGRDFERESDHYSRTLLWEMGIDTQPVADLFSKLAGELDQDSNDDSTSIFSTHPGFKERVLFFSEPRP